jgi:chromatin structure-remodeling complex subunit SFH1
VWNINEALIKPEIFARIFCNDLDIPQHPWVETVAAQIRAQLEDHEGVASMELGQDGAMDADTALAKSGEEVHELPECRVILSVRFHSYFHDCCFTDLFLH